jgi:predicted Zn-dependent protease
MAGGSDWDRATAEIGRRFGMTRREFLHFSALSSLALAAGCAADPVTGQTQVMFVSEHSEIAIDRRNSPHMFSNDYGAVQDKQLASYVEGVGRRLSPHTHRPDMPYRFMTLNETSVNAYTFPAGSMGILRGLLLNLESEAALANVLGHELGHVSARHTAEAMTTRSLAQITVIAVGEYAKTKGRHYEELTYALGLFASKLLLAKYSRNNEREADALGLDYMIRAGYNPRGAVEVMELLAGFYRRKPSFVDLMFATHPMSEERYRTAVGKVEALPPSRKDLPLHRERFMDSTAGLRALRSPIEMMQNGDREMHRGNLSVAEKYYRQALNHAPDDYAGLLKMAKCMYAKKDYPSMKRFSEEAKAAYPGEAQAYQVGGMASVEMGDHEAALENFTVYGKALRGNPNTNYFKGLALEGMGRRKDAARRYSLYLKRVRNGPKAGHALRRLDEWGY